jgi:hypothetical protein
MSGSTLKHISVQLSHAFIAYCMEREATYCRFMDISLVFSKVFQYDRGTWYRSWMRHYATNWTAASSIPDKLLCLFFQFT